MQLVRVGTTTHPPVWIVTSSKRDRQNYKLLNLPLLIQQENLASEMIHSGLNVQLTLHVSLRTYTKHFVVVDYSQHVVEHVAKDG